MEAYPREGTEDRGKVREEKQETETQSMLNHQLQLSIPEHRHIGIVG